LVRAGHDPERVLDYSWTEFWDYVRWAAAHENRRTSTLARLLYMAGCAAQGSQDAAEAFQEATALLDPPA
jgi:hypothetical protein